MKGKQKGLGGKKKERKAQHRSRSESDTERKCNSHELKKKTPHTFKNKFFFKNSLQKKFVSFIL